MKPIQRIFIISGVIALAGLGISVYLMFWGPEKLEIAGKSLPELLETGDLVPIIVIPIALIITALAMIPFFRIIFPSQIKNGVNAYGKVLKVWDTGVSINDNPQVGMLLEVTPQDGSPFQAEAKTVVSRLNAALVQPGVTVEVVYDPNKPQRLQVKTLHILGKESGDASDRLEELNELRDKGLITAEEYQQKREEIIKAL